MSKITPTRLQMWDDAHGRQQQALCEELATILERSEAYKSDAMVAADHWKPDRVEFALDDAKRTIKKALAVCEKMKLLEAKRVAFMSMKD